MSDAIHGDSRLVPGRSFARTYAHPAYADPWEAVEDYRDVLTYAQEHPGDGSTTIANRFDLPRGRVRPWLDGSRPDCVRGLQDAEALGWIDVAPSSDTLRGLNVMLAWIFSGGSILHQTWMPYWVVRSEEDRALLDRAAELVDVELDYTRSASDSRARELRPVEDASVLGRVLTVLGAPRGGKDEAGDVSLPGYLENAPERVSQEFVQVYLRNRGRDGSDAVYFRKPRAAGYRRSLSVLVERLTGESVVNSGERLALSGEAARVVQGWPQPLVHGKS